MQTHSGKSMLTAFTAVASEATASNGNLLDSDNFNRWVERYSSQTVELHKKLDKLAKLDATVKEAQATTALNPFV